MIDGRTTQQQAAIDTPAPRALVSAGAGTGKTAVLVDRYLALLERDLRVSQIVAITFTRKAASEMLERIRAAIRARGESCRIEERHLWREREYDLESAHITTIHGFFGGILRDYAVEAGIDPAFTELDELQSTRLRIAARDTAIDWLVSQQAELAQRFVDAVGLRNIEEMLLGCDAENIIEWLAEQPPLDTAALLGKWQTQVRQHNERLLAELLHHPTWRSSIDVLSSVAADNPDDKGEQARRRILASAAVLESSDDLHERLSAVREMFTGFRKNAGSRKNWHENDLESFRGAASQLRGLIEQATKATHAALGLEVNDADADAANLMPVLWEAVQVFARQHAAAKQRTGSVDFDDLLYRTRDLLRSHPDVRRTLRRRYRAYLVDEFQDVDRVQEEVLRLLCEASGEGDAPAMFLVGDPQQSIYRFRRAEVEIFNEMRCRPREFDVELFWLQDNFRSVAELLEVINFIFQRLAPPGDLQPHDVAHEDLQSRRRADGEPAVELLLPGGLEDEEKLPSKEQRELEARYVAQRIVALVEQQELSVEDLADAGERRPATYSDIALLFRAMTDAPIYERALQQSGIPFRVIKRADFFTRQEFYDLRSLLRAVAYEEDDLALAGFLRSPMAAVSDEGLFWLTRSGALHEALSHDAGCSDLEAYDQSAVEFAMGLLTHLRRRRDRFSVAGIVEHALDRSGVEAVLSALPGGEERVVVLRKVIELADEFDRTSGGTVSEFLAYLDQIEHGRIELPEPEAGRAGGGVQLMSVHAAKGLEFPVVILPDLNREYRHDTPTLLLDQECGAVLKLNSQDGQTPAAYQLALASHRDKEFAERRRVFYVACTRARERLIFVGAPPGSGGEGISPNGSWMAWLTAVLGLPPMGGWESGVVRRDGISYLVQGAAAYAQSTSGQKVRLRESAVTEKSLPADELRANVAPVASLSALRYSVSQLLSYRQCAKRYHYRYVIGAAQSDEAGQPPGSRTEVEWRQGERTLLGREFGQLAHAMLQRWTPGSLNTAALIDRVLDDAGITGDMRGNVDRELGAMLDNFKDSKLAAQVASAVQVRSELAFVVQLGDALVEGIIDKVFQPGSKPSGAAAGEMISGSGCVIIDFKSDRIDADAAAQGAAHHSFQVQLYALALRLLLGDVATPALVYFLRPAVAVPVAVGAHQLEAVEAEARRLIAGLQELDFSPNTNHCPECPYGLRCPEARV